MLIVMQRTYIFHCRCRRFHSSRARLRTNWVASSTTRAAPLFVVALENRMGRAADVEAAAEVG